MKNSQVIHHHSGRTLSGFTRFILPVMVGLALLLASAAHAGVISAKKIQFTSLIFVDKTTAPENVLFSGPIGVASDIGTPTGTCTPTQPCIVPGAVALASFSITGIGQTSGLKYKMLGLGAKLKRNLEVPGSTVLTTTFIIVPPLPIKPVGVSLLTVPVRTVFTFNAAGQIQQVATPPLGLASWWQAEGTAADVLGANNGTLSIAEAVTFVPGSTGQAFHFANQGFVEVPSSASLEPAKVTVGAWVRNAGSPGLFSHIVSKGAIACDNSSYVLYTGVTGGLQFYISDGSTASVSPDAGAAIWDGNWHYAAGTYDGANVRLYVDGVEVGTGTPSALTINYALPTNDAFYIGAFKGTCDLRFNGDVDDVQVFGRSLLPAEVLGVFNAGH